MLRAADELARHMAPRALQLLRGDRALVQAVGDVFHDVCMPVIQVCGGALAGTTVVAPAVQALAGLALCLLAGIMSGNAGCGAGCDYIHLQQAVLEPCRHSAGVSMWHYVTSPLGIMSSH